MKNIIYWLPILDLVMYIFTQIVLSQRIYEAIGNGNKAGPFYRYSKMLCNSKTHIYKLVLRKFSLSKSSFPSSKLFNVFIQATIAQLVAYQHGTGEVPGSNPSNGENFSVKISNWIILIWIQYVFGALAYGWYAAVHE